MSERGIFVGGLKRLLADHVALAYRARAFLWRKGVVAERKLVQADVARLTVMTDEIGSTILAEGGCPPIEFTDLATLASDLDPQRMTSPFRVLGSGHRVILDDLDLVEAASCATYSDGALELFTSLRLEHSTFHAAYVSGRTCLN